MSTNACEEMKPRVKPMLSMPGYVSPPSAIDAVCCSPSRSESSAFMNTGVTRYSKSPSSSAWKGKCTQRNFWIGASSVENCRLPWVWLWSSLKFSRLFSG